MTGQQAEGNGQQAEGNGQQAEGNGQQAAGSRQQAARQKAEGNGQQAAGSREDLRALVLSLSPKSSLAEAARSLICLQAREIEANLPGALTTLEPAPLHDARVAGRRLRAGVTIFRRLYPGVWENAEKMARKLTRCLRIPRDLDIRSARLWRMMRDLGDGDRERKGNIGMFLEQTVMERKAFRSPPGPLREDLARHLLPALWRPRFSRGPSAERFVRVRLGELAQRTAMLIPTSCVEPRGGVQHRLRISCKALRYSLEMMEWRLGGELDWRLKVLREVQDVLGDIHDIDVFGDYFAGKTSHGDSGRTGVFKDIGRGLGEERHNLFGRFLDIRAELERAVAPVTF
jgi:CHAD domain-containing protein